MKGGAALWFIAIIIIIIIALVILGFTTLSELMALFQQ